MQDTYDSDNIINRGGTAPLLRSTSITRTVIIAVLNLGSFIVAAMFWQYIQTGSWIDFSAASFRHALSTSLGHGLIHPLSIFRYPWMVLVSGLMLGMIVFVPVMMAVLYRLFWAFAFVAVVGIFAHAPLLALALAIGCFLAARTPLRSDVPFLAFLLGMAPVAVYIYLFGFSVVGSLAVQPLQRGLAYAPFLLAIIASVLCAALVLWQAGLIGYRYGAICPALLMLLIVPIILFYAKVGSDELEFSLIADRLIPGGSDISKPVPLKEWKQRYNQHGLSDQRLPTAVNDNLEKLSLELILDCETFLETWPESKRASSLLWLAAQCTTLELNRPAIEQGYVMYSSAYPSQSSQKFWKRLVDSYPYEPQAGIAHFQLARLELKKVLTPLLDHKFISDYLNQAKSYLDIAEKQLLVAVTEFDRRQSRRELDRVFLPPRLMPVAGEYRNALFEVQRLKWLIASNDIISDWFEALELNDNKKIQQARRQIFALAEYELLNHNMPDYRKQIARLIDKYESTKMCDNLMLAHANAANDPYERANALIALADINPPSDAAIQASFELGILSSGTAAATAVSLMPNLKTPTQYFQLVISAAPNPWIPQASERLKWLEK